MDEKALRRLVEDIAQQEIKKAFYSFLHPEVCICVLPGGKLIERKSDGAIGFDACLRAIVDGNNVMDPNNPVLRNMVFDFKHLPKDPAIRKKIVRVSGPDAKPGEIGFKLLPGESVLGGIGFSSAMLFPLFYWVAPRSGLASRLKISIINTPGTVDPDYRGEAGALIHNFSRKPFVLRHQMRVVQVIFQWAVIPRIKLVKNHFDLPKSGRGVGGFGSTGFF